MKLSSGVKHVLVDECGHTGRTGRLATQAREVRALPGPQRPASRRPARSGAAQSPPATSARRRPLGRSRTLALVGLAASAVLLGCTSLPNSNWRVEPVLRVEGGSASAAPGYLALAQKYEGENRVEQALDAYASAAKSAPDSADVQNALGLALARHGRIEAAITVLRRAVAMAPGRAALLNNLAYALLLDGRTDDARAMFRLTLAVDPAHQIASRNLAHLNQQHPVTAATPPAPVAAASADAVVAAAVPVPAALAVADVAPAVVAGTRVEPVPESIAAASAPVISEAPSAPIKAATQQLRRDDLSIEIMNGNGVGGAATRMRDLLQEQGIYARRVANLPPYKSTSTQVLYRPGKAEEARLVMQRMPVDADVLPAPAGSTLADLRVVIGHDARRSAGCTALAACAVAEGSAGSTDRKARRL